MVLNLGVYCSRFLTNDFVDTDVLVGGTNFSIVVDFSKSFLYSGLLTDLKVDGEWKSEY
jgi:hypothetical protein